MARVVDRVLIKISEFWSVAVQRLASSGSVKSSAGGVRPICVDPVWRGSKIAVQGAPIRSDSGKHIDLYDVVLSLRRMATGARAVWPARQPLGTSPWLHARRWSLPDDVGLFGMSSLRNGCAATPMAVDARRIPNKRRVLITTVVGQMGDDIR